MFNILLNRAAIGWAVSCSAFGFFSLSVTISKPLRMMSSLANYKPFLSSFRRIPPQEHFLTEHGRLRNVYLVKIGPNTVGDAHQEICKDKECNLGPVAGY